MQNLPSTFSMNKILIIFISILLSSCNFQSNQSLEETIQNSILESTYNETGIYATVNDFKITPVDNENYKGYIILTGEGETWKYELDIFYNNIEWRWQFTSDGEQLYVDDNNTVYEEDNTSYEEDFSFYDYLISNSFTLNGNGYVKFSPQNKTKGTIIIKGGRADLHGYYTIGVNSVSITDLKAVYGNFDASNNNSSNGTLYLKDNGNIEGSIYSGANSSKLILIPN